MRREQRVKAASKPSAWQSVACGLDVCQENWGRSEKSPTSKCCTGVLLGCANARFEWWGAWQATVLASPCGRLTTCISTQCLQHSEEYIAQSQYAVYQWLGAASGKADLPSGNCVALLISRVCARSIPFFKLSLIQCTRCSNPDLVLFSVEAPSNKFNCHRRPYRLSALTAQLTSRDRVFILFQWLSFWHGASGTRHPIYHFPEPEQENKVSAESVWPLADGSCMSVWRC